MTWEEFDKLSNWDRFEIISPMIIGICAIIYFIDCGLLGHYILDDGNRTALTVFWIFMSIVSIKNFLDVRKKYKRVFEWRK